jgi:hypothetical protein
MPRQRHERRVAGSTPSSGATCLSVRSLLLVEAHMRANTGATGEILDMGVRKIPADLRGAKTVRRGPR